MKISNIAKSLIVILCVLLQPVTVLGHAKDKSFRRTLIDWQSEVPMARTLAMDVDMHSGGEFIAWKLPGGVEEREGHQCLIGPYFFFDIDDDYLFDLDETVTLELLVDRSQTNGFNISYDHAVKPEARQVRLVPDYGERMEVVSVTLERARFANRKYELTDIAIGALGSVFPKIPGENLEIALCGMKIVRSQTPPPRPATGTLKLKVHNEMGKPDAVRAGLYDDSGWMPLPSADAVDLIPHTQTFKQWPLLFAAKGWPTDGRFIFYINGEYRAELPEGEYNLVLYKGPEYRFGREKVIIRAGKTNTVEIGLKRWTDMPQRGWYSADGHIHIDRRTPEKNAGILAYTKAEDVHLSNLLHVTNVFNDSYRQYAFGRKGDYSEGSHWLVSGQETPRSSQRGHTIGLNVSKLHWNAEDYYLYSKTAESIHRDGGLWGYAHVASEEFNFNAGYGLALDVPLGHVDFVEMLQWSKLNTSYLYDFLNIGFKMLPAAGSDYPFLDVIGSERIYAKIDGPFSPAAWFDAYANNRSFVSNGPIIEFTVNGESDKTEYDLAAGESISISATASVNPDIDHLARLELVVHGEVVDSVISTAGAETLQLNCKLSPEDSQWFAIRTYGTHKALAHTAPVYLYVDGNKRFWNLAVVEDVATKYIGVLREFKDYTPDLDDEWARSLTEDYMLPKWNAVKPELQREMDRGIAVYQRLIDEASNQ